MAPPTMYLDGSVDADVFEPVTGGCAGHKLLPLAGHALSRQSDDLCAFIPKWSLGAESSPPSLHAIPDAGGGGAPGPAKVQQARRGAPTSRRRAQGDPLPSSAAAFAAAAGRGLANSRLAADSWEGTAKFVPGLQDHGTGFVDAKAVDLGAMAVGGTRLNHAMTPPPGFWGASAKEHSDDALGVAPEIPSENVNKLEELIRLYLDGKGSPDEKGAGNEAPTPPRSILSSPPGLTKPDSPSDPGLSTPPSPMSPLPWPTQGPRTLTLSLALLTSSEESSSGDDLGLKEMTPTADAAARTVQWSCGSIGHPYACADPCKYAKKKRGCKDGVSCTRCHLCKHKRAKQVGSPDTTAGGAAGFRAWEPGQLATLPCPADWVAVRA